MEWEKYKPVLFEYRIPIIICGAGIFFLIIGAVLFFKNQTNSSPIEFTQKESTQSAAIKTIQVDVQGAVKSPAVYTFTDGSRVSDALNSAGGLTAKADVDWINKNMNRAAKLIDGGKIYIPSLEDKSEGKLPITNNQFSNNSQNNTLGVTTGLVNINSASASELDTLAGVGEVTAGKIISGRPYGSIDELKTKKAVGSALFEKIKDKLTI